MTASRGDGVRAALSRDTLPPRFERIRETLYPGAVRPSTPDEWRGAIVLVERGTLEVRCRDGASRRFAPGALLPLACVPVVGLRAVGDGPVEILAVRRLASDQ